MPSDKQLLEAAQSFLDAFSSASPSMKLVNYFSTTMPAFIEHAPSSSCRQPPSRLIGLNALRSYFDLLSMNFKRPDVIMRGTPAVDGVARRVVIVTSTGWTWKMSGRKWTEDSTWILDFDESFKIRGFTVKTMSDPKTCVLQAVDVEAPRGNAANNLRQVALTTTEPALS